MRMRRPSEDDEMHDHMVSGWGDMSRVACVLVIDGPGGGPWVCYKKESGQNKHEGGNACKSRTNELCAGVVTPRTRLPGGLERSERGGWALHA